MLFYYGKKVQAFAGAGIIVRGGVLSDLGMPSFGSQMSDTDLRSLQAYIVSRARIAMR